MSFQERLSKESKRSKRTRKIVRNVALLCACCYFVALSSWWFQGSENTLDIRYPTLKECGVHWGHAKEDYLRQLLHDRLSGVNDTARNAHLRNSSLTRVFFALNLHNAEAVTPYVLSAILKACLVYNITDAHSSSCFISIYESGSADGTRQLLRAFDEDLHALSISHRLILGGRERLPEQHRIAFLADMRNMVMGPFYENPGDWDEVIFLNDVVTCASGILELVHQKQYQNADVVSGMDYVQHAKCGTLFYDTWVNKDIKGQSFRNGAPFIEDADTWSRYVNMQPFQVFTTWAGGVVISANLFRKFSIRFRHSSTLECASCECELLIRDLWHLSGSQGLKVLVVPSVFVTYSLAEFRTVASHLRSHIFSSNSNVIALDGFLGTTSKVQFKQTPPAAFSCAGMEYGGEQLVDFERLVTSAPWEWWYSLRNDLKDETKASNVTLRFTLQSAIDFYKEQCTQTDRSRLRSNKIPAVINFVLPTDEPTKMPHVAFMNMLEWIRLNPCFDAHMYSLQSAEAELFTNAPSNWTSAFNTLVAFQDPFYRFLDSYDRYRIVGFLALYLNGGIFADLEAAPIRALTHLTDFEDLEASFDENAYGGGPFITIATPRLPKMRRIIDGMLSAVNNRTNLLKKMTQRSVVYGITATLFDSSATLVLERIASASTGMELLTSMLGKIENSRKLAQHVTLRLYDKPVRVPHEFLFKLSDGEILTDGEFLVSSVAPYSYTDSIILNTIAREKRTTSFSRLSRQRVLFLWLRTSSSMPSRAYEVGCLQVRADITLEDDDIIWEVCWPRSSELGNTYMAYELGELTVYTMQKSCAMSTNIRRTLWSSAQMRVKPNARSSRAFELRLAPSGELFSTSTQNVVSNAILEQHAHHRCRVDLFDFYVCNNYFNHSIRQLIRYRQLCETIH